MQETFQAKQSFDQIFPQKTVEVSSSNQLNFISRYLWSLRLRSEPGKGKHKKMLEKSDFEKGLNQKLSIS